jgi:propanediol dehydratase-reactivating factor small subunit
MTNNKPTILLYTVNPSEKILKEICAGIEEEGLLYEQKSFHDKNIHELSFLAANESVLGSGIGINHSKVALQLRAVPKGKNVFYLEKPTLEECRKIGSNAARAVKRIPFKK